MNIAVYLANKIQNTRNQTFSSLIIKVGIASVALGLSALLISFSVLFGFKNTIKNKLFSISSHIQVSKITLNRSFEEVSMTINSEINSYLAKNPEISTVNVAANKSAILKSETEIAGVVLKGIDRNFNWSTFDMNLSEGKVFQHKDTTYSNDILISRKLKDQLNVKLNDEILIYFIQDPPRARKLHITGIYETGIEEIDQNYIIGDINLIRKINGWNDNEIGHYEIYLKDFSHLDQVAAQLADDLPQDYQISPITKMLPQFFEWFNLLDRNIILVIILIIAVASFNMISVLLIMIMERTPMIGLLKSIGALNSLIRGIFIRNGLKIIIKGLLAGNIIGLGLCFIQDKFKLLHLDPENYYMSFVPVEWNWPVFMIVNVVTLLIIGMILIIPTFVTSRISPVEALKYKD
ncbi:ABC transporter permease [Emticicia sp. CRIBPO]|uniref:ABC transporter permease n=1 Tax=Emticicia sp. CRIBPO TaxID=2683258 RepID=UPI0014125C22|nr:FtsX-like permease family protein [Emticicia sp. CRIBPO]NBA87617.1 ABC transporter permease [Emticicia sp. CRIBPO]